MGVIMVWAMDALSGNRGQVEQGCYYGLGHGCSGNRRQVEHGCYYGLSHGCCGNRRQVEHGCYYGLGMDAVVTAGKSNRDAIMVWAQGSRTLLCLPCSHHAKMPRPCRCLHIRSKVQVAARRRRFQPRAPHSVMKKQKSGTVERSQIRGSKKTSG